MLKILSGIGGSFLLNRNEFEYRMKPNFLVIGAMKCGTTSLCSLLGQHPDIFMSNPKETYFFSNDEVYQRGSSWYESIFLGSENKIAIGEGSTNYSKKYIFPKEIFPTK